MTELKENWLTEGLIDFEYKKYHLLAYLKHVRENFDGRKLYPFLSDLVHHYRTLRSFQENRNLLFHQFPRSLSGVDFDARKLRYKRLMEDTEVMAELRVIMEFAIERFADSLNHGKEVYDYVEEHVEFEAVGIAPIYTQEGYFLVHQADKKDVGVYHYQIGMFGDAGQRYRSVSTEYLHSATISLTRTYENIKMEVVRANRELPNPATYLVYSKINVPLEETLLPVARRMLVRRSTAGDRLAS
jgi:hypothetical protein